MPEPSFERLVESIVGAGAEWGYDVTRDAQGVLHIASIRGNARTAPLRFRFTVHELRDYYARLAGQAGTSGGAGTAWATWMMLMPTHLGEAVYKAGTLGQSCVIVIDEGGFWAQPADGPS